MLHDLTTALAFLSLIVAPALFTMRNTSQK